MRTEKVETDVLCIGGGIAGLMAAIKASEIGARVVIAEKANVLRSGSAGMGNDHFNVYVPEVHGLIEPFVKKLANSRLNAYTMRPESFYRTQLEKSSEIVKLWESWGIPMKYKGKYEFSGGTALKYYGQNQKRILSARARKSGIKILNRVMVFDLLCGTNGIIGAVGIRTDEEKCMEFHAKAVVVGTGKCMRLYPGQTPAWMFNFEYCPAVTGDGRAMAYRAGAELANMEKIMRWAGLKYFSRCGKGTWVGVLRDPKGKPIGPFLTKPDRHTHGDPISDEHSTFFEDYAKEGKGPIYMSNKYISDEDLEYQNLWLIHEGNTTVLDYLRDEGIDTRKEGLEFTTYGLQSWGGIPYNEKGETSIKGLYAAGDEYGSTGSQAAIFGWIAGDNAARYVLENASDHDATRIKAETKARNDFLDTILFKETGASWEEVNAALQQVMQDYAGSIRSESVLKAGLRHIRKIKEKAHNSIMAKNQHELMRCLEVLNLLDLGELVFVAALERRETRVTHHIRADYPFTDPKMEKVLIIKMKDGKPVTEWREREQ